MEEFKKRGIDIQMVTTDALSEAYSQMMKKHQNYLYENLVKAIQKHLRGMSKLELESLIDRYFLTDMKYHGKQTISKLNEGFQNAFIETLDATDGKSTEQILTTYSERIKVPLRRNQMDWLDEISIQFSRQLRKKIDLYFAPFTKISSENIERTIDNVDREIMQIMKQYKQKFNQDYQMILNEFLSVNLKQISTLLEKRDLTNKQANNFQMYHAIAELSNHELMEEDNHLYAKNISTGEMVELTMQGDLLSSSDRTIRYRLDTEKQRIGYYNNQTKVAILVHNGLITVVLPPGREKEKRMISFAKKGHRYQLYYNLKPVVDPNKIQVLVEQIAKHAEGIYHKLEADPDFENLLPKKEEGAKEEKPQFKQEPKEEEENLKKKK